MDFLKTILDHLIDLREPDPEGGDGCFLRDNPGADDANTNF